MVASKADDIYVNLMVCMLIAVADHILVLMVLVTRECVFLMLNQTSKQTKKVLLCHS